MENGFILLIEKEIFIDQLKDIVDKAEDMLSEDVEGERPGALRDTPLQGSSPGGMGDEVSRYIKGESLTCVSKTLLFKTKKINMQVKKINNLILLFV